MDIAATNLYFIYFLEKNLKLAEDYTYISVKTIRYNANALVNKRNCLFIKSVFTISK